MIFELQQVRCWEESVSHGGESQVLLLTYPEGSLGYRLVSCLQCGTVYAANVTKQLYVGPSLPELLGTLVCQKCGAQLGTSGHPYPEKYLGIDGEVHSYERPPEIPQDSDAVVRELPDLYSPRE